MTPHATRRNAVTFIVAAGFITLILISFLSCTKQKPFQEPLPSDHSIRERQFKLVFPNYGQGCDTTTNGGL